MFKNVLLAMVLVSSGLVNAAVVAVVDSGVDVEHKDLVSKVWINTDEIADNGRDEDRNGYQDDVYGWNFAENNNLVIDRKYLGTFSQDPYKFFEIQGKLFTGVATQEERKWVESKLADPLFMREMMIFGNFVHGTHVAGISAKGNDSAKVLSVKLIPTEIKLPGQEDDDKDDVVVVADDEPMEEPSSDPEVNEFRKQLAKMAIAKIAVETTKTLEEITVYIRDHKADVMNGSFGTGHQMAKNITDTVFKAFLFRDPSEEESREMALHFFDTILAKLTNVFGQAPNTLFVFAAGNDGSNNDEFPTSPTNVKRENVISVAATYRHAFLAPFSNYGIENVDVAAPGMLIHSQIPGDEYLAISGTSQAAPYVANIAAQIKDINPELSPLEIKKIIMGTVDKKDYLATKIKAGGIVNTDRAVHAAKLSLTGSLSVAVAQARTEVADVASMDSKFMTFPNLVRPIQLPSTFILK